MDSRSILLAGIDSNLEAHLRAAVPEAPLTVLPDFNVSKESLRELHPQVALVGFSEGTEGSFRLVSTLASLGARVVMVGPSKDADLILRAMREGAREWVVRSDLDEIVRAIRDQSRPPRAAGMGTVIAVFPAKGGVGATAIATNLAGMIARNGDRVCLLDLDFAMGDDLAFLDLTGGVAISDVVANMRRLDRDLLDASVLRHRSGVHVIAQTEKMEQAAQIDAASLSTLIQFLRQHYKAVLLDGLRTFDDHTVAALDAADQIMLVVTQEVPAVRRAHRCVSFLRRLGHDESRLKLVVNRHAKSAEVADELLSETVGLPIAATLSSDYPALVRAINRGLLLLDAAPRSTLTKDIERLLAFLGPPAPLEEKRSLLKRLFTKAAAHAG